MNLIENTRNSAETPFVYFVSGTPVYPPNTLYECAGKALALKGDFRDLLKNEIEEGFIGGTLSVSPATWWFNFLLQYFEYFRNNFSEPEEMESSATEILRLIMSKPPEEAWAKVLEHVIKDVDNLSGWNKSWLKESAESRNVFKEKDGNYYYKDLDGTLIRIIGAKTTQETHLDFVTDQILRGYGCLRQIFNVFSTFSITHEFSANPTTFPKSMKAVLTEPRFHETSHYWRLMQFERTRSVKWRPLSNFCDPEWLAGDMLARITDTLDRDTWKERVEKYETTTNALDPDCKRQMDYVLDSIISIGSQDEIYFQFEGRTFRWINGTTESKAVISIGTKDMTDHRAEDECMNRLLSVLVWQHRQPIVKGDGIGGPRRPIPLVWAPRTNFGLHIDPQNLFGKTGVSSAKRWLALALYKEGVNSASVFYRFLNFWKIIEVALKDKDARWKWINSTALQSGIHKTRVLEITTKSPDIAEYLDYSGRCAIAHVFREPIVNPDDYDDYVRIRQDVRLVEDLARDAVNQFLPLT
jgi:hypothetical protein